MAEELRRLLTAHFERVQQWSTMCLEGLGDEQALAIPPGAGNHVLWELGHICLTRNLLVTWGCAGGERLAENWETNFGFGSTVHTRAADYPSLDDIRRELERGGRQVRDYIQTLVADELSAPAPNLPERIFADRLSAFVHLLSHEAYHVGKISLLRKLMGLKTISELFFGK